jgi:hypothetical protein
VIGAISREVSLPGLSLGLLSVPPLFAVHKLRTPNLSAPRGDRTTTMSSDAAEDLPSPTDVAPSIGGASTGEAVAREREHEHEHGTAVARDGAVPTDVAEGNDAVGDGETETWATTAAVDRLHNESWSFVNEIVHDPTYPPSTEMPELTLEDFYNPRNLTLDELEMVLYEWEEEGTSVKEYIDMSALIKLRTGESDEGWTEEEEEEEEEQDGDGEGEEPKGWTSRLKKWATGDDGSKAKVDGDAFVDDGSKTKVEFKKKGPKKYLNLTDDVFHVVEFYAPWYVPIPCVPVFLYVSIQLTSNGNRNHSSGVPIVNTTSGNISRSLKKFNADRFLQVGVSNLIHTAPVHTVFFVSFLFISNIQTLHSAFFPPPSPISRSLM